MAAPTFFSGKGGGVFVMKEYEIIMLKYNGKSCRLYLLFFCAPEDIILYAIRPGSMQFEDKYFYKLIRSKGWQHASWWRKQNSTYPVLSRYKQGLAINLPWPALKNKQCMCFELFEVFLTLSNDQCFFFKFYLYYWIYTVTDLISKNVPKPR